eukprot:12491592-Alexandrium_andersonii.AAC.1
MLVRNDPAPPVSSSNCQWNRGKTWHWPPEGGLRVMSQCGKTMSRRVAIKSAVFPGSTPSHLET